MTFPCENHAGYPLGCRYFQKNTSNLLLLIDSSVLHVMQVKVTGPSSTYLSLPLE
uniref:Uncharacterized protein n=1 Tax=Anguilla anguilla TaxID=7936 RepID=A0A0E9QEV1_ANGAN